MKRALAERAKQSISNGLNDSNNSAASTPEAPTSHPPPLKIKRTHSSSEVAGQKRPREENTTNDNESSSFYLKHQNRALATELSDLQFQVSQLTEERDYRRQHVESAIQALHNLQATWTQLETALTTSQTPTYTSSSPPEASNNGPVTTGNAALEVTESLLQALGNLGGGSNENLQQMALNVSSRAAVLQEWIWKWLQGQGRESTLEMADLVRQLENSKSKCQFLQNQIDELQHVRQETLSRERRLRRNVYRLQAGILNMDQVLQSIGQDDNDQLAQVKLEAQQQQLKKQSEDESAVKEEEEGRETKVSSSEIQALQAQLKDAQEQMSNREKTIQELNAKLKEKELQINRLASKQQSDEDVQKLQSLRLTEQKLQQSEVRASELESKVERLRNELAQTLGNEKTLQSSIDDLQTNYNRRLSEIASEEISGNNVSPQDEAKEIAELRHKLHQALEHVRQAETARENLQTSMSMNESLQSKLEELRSKYTALQQQQRSTDSQRPETAPKESNSKDTAVAPTEKETSEKPAEKQSSAELNREKFEKLHKEHRRMRKDLAQAMASKEAAKAKLERAEKERDGLFDSNARLLKQISEKDDMNAKSLSTILHLKSMTEQLTVERDNLEQQVKSASQLALAARLATNAKERVSEEVLKEKNALEERLEELETKHAETKAELDRIQSEWSDASCKMTILNSELTNALARCDELVAESEKKQEEIRTLVDSVTKAEREAREAREQLEGFTRSGGAVVASSFTVDQLNTQISVLKSRLACPVCHYRDKECIITRCRHMHCKQCVEERISNRSRKCPTCNVKFSETDVGDVWLK